MDHATFEQPPLQAGVRQRLTQDVLRQLNGSEIVSDDRLMHLILIAITNHFAGSAISFSDRRKIAQYLFDSMRGFDVIQPLLDHPQITEIMVNGPDKIFFEQNGHLYLSALHFDHIAHLTDVITHFFGRYNRLIHENNPISDLRLQDGSRVHAVLPPVAPQGPILTIRKFTGFEPQMQTLIEQNFISRQAADFVSEAINTKKNFFICGGTGSGKTTFLNILARFIPAKERIITIEDAAELDLYFLPNWVSLEARQAGPDGTGAVILTHLIRAALRMRPDRIVVGEVRGPEAFDMLQAMNTGHPGSLSTGHANSCIDMVNRLALMVLMGIQLPWNAILSLIASALDIIIHLQRNEKGSREISEICTVGLTETGQINLCTIFNRSPEGSLLYVKNEH